MVNTKSPRCGSISVCSVQSHFCRGNVTFGHGWSRITPDVPASSRIRSLTAWSGHCRQPNLSFGQGKVTKMWKMEKKVQKTECQKLMSKLLKLPITRILSGEHRWILIKKKRACLYIPLIGQGFCGVLGWEQTTPCQNFELDNFQIEVDPFLTRVRTKIWVLVGLKNRK